MMIVFNIEKLRADYSLVNKKSLSQLDLANATGISRTVISRLARTAFGKHYATTTDNAALLCVFFSCRLDELMTIRE